LRDGVRGYLTQLQSYQAGFLSRVIQGVNTTSQGQGPDIQAADTIQMSAWLHKIIGPGTVRTILPPSNFAGFLTLCAPDPSEGLPGFSLGTGGNIAINKVIKVSEGAVLFWHPAMNRWHVVPTIQDMGDIPGLAGTEHEILVSEGAGAPISSVGPLTNGQLLIGSTGLDPVAAALTAGNGIGLTPGAGSLAIAALLAGTANQVVVTLGPTIVLSLPLTIIGPTRIEILNAVLAAGDALSEGNPIGAVAASTGKFTALSLGAKTLVFADSPYSANAGESTFYEAPASAGSDFTFNLPPATGSGQIIIVQKVDANAHNIVINPNGADTINGANSAVNSTITLQYDVTRLRDSGVGTWFVW
jgi:hypothetical protein